VVDGFVLVDKPTGWTSHDVVARARSLLRERKIGHAGTLDPMATGLLVLGVGRATRLIRFAQEGVKVYEATALFGVATDTLDADGGILSRDEMHVSEDEVRAAAKRFIGRIPQVPPMVSAKKVDGRRLYEMARAGLEVEREPVMVHIHDIEVVDVSPGPYPEVELRVRCGTGTYVRTLADDIAAALGGRAHLTALRRTSTGSLSVEDAHTIEHLAAAADGGTIADLVMAPAEGLRDLPAVTVASDTAVAVGNGSVFPAAALGINQAGHHRILDGSGTLLAVYQSDGRRASPEVVLA
jgi:tRNA pseudouridine55 synthase